MWGGQPRNRFCITGLHMLVYQSTASSRVHPQKHRNTHQYCCTASSRLHPPKLRDTPYCCTTSSRLHPPKHRNTHQYCCTASSIVRPPWFEQQTAARLCGGLPRIWLQWVEVVLDHGRLVQPLLKMLPETITAQLGATGNQKRGAACTSFKLLFGRAFAARGLYPGLSPAAVA